MRQRSTRALAGSAARATALGAALLVPVVLSGCDRSGARVRVSGGGGSPGGAVLDVDFAFRRDLSLGSGFVGDALAIDLDENGLTDIVESNFGTKEVTVTLGLIDGTFSRVAVFRTIGHGFKLASGDFDGNGMRDVAVACGDYNGTGESSLYVFPQGPASGEFSTSILLEMLSDPKDLAVAPLTGVAGDPGPDELFVALRAEQRVARVSLVGGRLIETGSLDTSALAAVGGPYTVAVVDIGGDGLVDLVVGEEEVEGGNPDRIVAFPRNAGGFGAPVSVLEPVFQPIVDAAGDVDGNGFEDLGVAQLGEDRVYLLLGDAGGFGSFMPIDFEGDTSSVLFADLDLNGLTDVVATVVNQSSVAVRLATGRLSWGAPMRYNVGIVPRAIGAVLLPGDAIPDLLCGNAFDLSILFGVGRGFFRGALGFPTGARGPVAVRAGDLDNDGDADVVSIGFRQHAISFQENVGSGELVTRIVLPLGTTLDETPGHVVFSDLDDDGLLDVVVSVNAANEVRIFRNRGALNLFTEPGDEDILAVGSRPLGLDACDLDGDLMPDVLVVNAGDKNAQVLLNDGSGNLSPQAPVQLGFPPTAVRCMDLDNDGAADAIVSTGAITEPPPDPQANLILLRNDGSGVLRIENLFQTNFGASSIDVGDFDEDGLVDIAVGQTGIVFDALFVFLNQGDFAFDASFLRVGANPNLVIVADADEDGHLDIVVPSGAENLRIAYGDGTGAFPRIEPQANQSLACLFEANSVAWADMNGDELPDLVLVATHSPLTWIGFNASSPIEEE